MDKNKLEELLDASILRHGFTDYNRDYDFLIEIGPPDNSEQFILRFKHVYELTYQTTLTFEALKISTNDNFIDYKKWQETGEKGGFVWGVNYSLAYPGFDIIENSEKADKWTKELGLEMFDVRLETNTYKIDFVTHDFELIEVTGDKK